MLYFDQMIEYTRKNICPETAKSEVSKVIVELYSLCQLRLRKNCQLTLRDLGIELGLGLVLVNYILYDLNIYYVE